MWCSTRVKTMVACLNVWGRPFILKREIKFLGANIMKIIKLHGKRTHECYYYHAQNCSQKLPSQSEVITDEYNDVKIYYCTECAMKFRQWNLKSNANQSFKTYMFISMIGQDDFGDVYLAWDKRNGRTVELHIINKTKKHVKSFYSWFEEEIEMMSVLKHPTISRLYDSGVTDTGDCYYAVTEMDVGNIYDRARTDLDSDNYFPSVTYGTQIWRPCVSAVHVLDALQYMHKQGIVHGSIMPEVIKICRSYECENAEMGGGICERDDITQLGTFGITSKAKLFRKSRGDYPSNALFCQFIQLVGDSEPVPDWDIYSMGMVLYFSMTGQFPFEYPIDNKHTKLTLKKRAKMQMISLVGGERPVPIKSRLMNQPTYMHYYDEDLDDIWAQLFYIIDKSICVLESQRYKTASDFKNDLKEWIGLTYDNYYPL